MPLSAGADQNQTTSRILNKLQHAVTDVAADITTATTSDVVLFFDASDNYEPKYGDGANILEAAGITATAAEINAAADSASRFVNVTDAATYTVQSLGQSQQQIVKLTADAAEKIRKISKLANAATLVGGLLLLAGAVATGQPVPIVKAIEKVSKQLKLARA